MGSEPDVPYQAFLARRGPLSGVRFRTKALGRLHRLGHLNVL